jgi:hypothetical protein
LIATKVQDLQSGIKELRFPERDAGAPQRISNLPYNSLGPLFKGRDAELADLQQLTGTGSKAVGLTSRQAIHGLGGIGKTRLAIEYAWRQASDYPNAVLFVSVRSPADFRTKLASLCNAGMLNLPEQAQAEEAAGVAAAFRWLGGHSGWLLILDNADTPEAALEVENALPKLQASCRCLKCDCVSKRNRRSQALFVRISCGHRGNERRHRGGEISPGCSQSAGRSGL